MSTKMTKHQAKSKKNQKNKQKNPSAAQKAPANIKNNNILTRFFSHNITLMILSFLLAFTIWFIINANSQTESSVTIGNIPVTIELSETAQDDGLEVFGADDLKASVEVSGNRITVGSLSSDDISVYATQTGSIITPGSYTLPLNAKKTGIKNNYEIVSAVTPSVVTVRVDRRMETDLTIDKSRISIKDLDDQHYANVTLTPSTIHLNGPEQQVSKIAAAYVEVTFDSIPEEPVITKVIFRDSDNNELNFPLVTTDVDEVEVSVIVWPVKEVSASVNPVGVHDAPKYSISPAVIKIAGPQSELDKITDNKYVIGTLDFSTLKNEKYTKSFPLMNPSGCKITSPSDMKAEVTVDLTSYSSKTLSCTVKPSTDSAEYDVRFDSDTIAVELYGPSSLLDTIDSSKLSAVADFTSYLEDIGDSSLTIPSVPVRITITDDSYGKCWVYGVYTASAIISKKP